MLLYVFGARTGKALVVEMRVKGEKLTCTARQVIDENLRREILTLRDSSPRMERVVFEIKPRQTSCG
jgi:hypothetical protein